MSTSDTEMKSIHKVAYYFKRRVDCTEHQQVKYIDQTHTEKIKELTGGVDFAPLYQMWMHKPGEITLPGSIAFKYDGWTVFGFQNKDDFENYQRWVNDESKGNEIKRSEQNVFCECTVAAPWPHHRRPSVEDVSDEEFSVKRPILSSEAPQPES